MDGPGFLVSPAVPPIAPHDHALTQGGDQNGSQPDLSVIRQRKYYVAKIARLTRDRRDPDLCSLAHVAKARLIRSPMSAVAIGIGENKGARAIMGCLRERAKSDAKVPTRKIRSQVVISQSQCQQINESDVGAKLAMWRAASAAPSSSAMICAARLAASAVAGRVSTRVTIFRV